MDHLLFQVEVLLLDIGKRPWILDIIGIDLPLILALNSLVVLLIVSNVFVLKFLDDAFEILALVTLNHLVGQSLLRDVTIIEIDTDVLVLHLQIPRDGRVGHDLLEVLLRTIFDLVAVEHGDLGHVLECWLEPASDHHVLLNEFHVCPVVALRQLFFLADGNRVQTFVHASLRFAIERTPWTMKLALIRHLLLYLWKCLGRVVLVLNPESLLAHIVTYFWSQVLLEGGVRLRKFPLLQGLRALINCQLIFTTAFLDASKRAIPHVETEQSVPDHVLSTLGSRLFEHGKFLDVALDSSQACIEVFIDEQILIVLLLV